MLRLWDKWFLEERPSASLGLFRVFFAAAVGLHVIPTLLQLEDNYLAAGFREFNPSFFTPGALEWVMGHSDRTVRVMAGVFMTGWLCYLLGLLTRVSGLVMAAGCYYFYARNSLHIGTLSWDIMLVTLFLMMVTSYPGDSFSLDAFLSGSPAPWRRRRPIFLQRLLQLQIASTFFYTGLSKVCGPGNWWTDNPYFYLMNNPPLGVIKEFPFRGLLAARPGLCWLIGMTVVCVEVTFFLWLYWRRTRPYAIALGFFFHVMLVLTMHVPTIFFFLFPPQLMLFVAPETVARWIDAALTKKDRFFQRFSLGLKT